jgi:D-lyxose ketol-isomerase
MIIKLNCKDPEEKIFTGFNLVSRLHGHTLQIRIKLPCFHFKLTNFEHVQYSYFVLKNLTTMKRSEINAIISAAKEFFAEQKFMLPVWAFWPPEKWKNSYGSCSEIVDNKLGWDITDFGSDDFFRIGLMLFTIRNGSWYKKDKTYCEKIMISEEEQVTPMHFHWNKSEDIINRGGGKLAMELYYATEDDQLDSKPVTVSIDGILTTVNAGVQLLLMPGQSICLTPRLYHRFYAAKGGGKVMIGEVSMVNDDVSDNRFYEKIGRFPDIDEDNPPVHLLVNDYPRYI